MAGAGPQVAEPGLGSPHAAPLRNHVSALQICFHAAWHLCAIRTVARSYSSLQAFFWPWFPLPRTRHCPFPQMRRSCTQVPHGDSAPFLISLHAMWPMLLRAALTEHQPCSGSSVAP